MFDQEEYAMAVADLLAATIQEAEASAALSEACAVEVNEPMSHAVTQQKRLAVYAAMQAREEAAECFVIRWRRIGLSLTGTEQVSA